MRSRGSSRRIVPAPTMIASLPARSSSTRSRSASPDSTSRPGPAESRQPSTDIAQLSSTYGRPVTTLRSWSVGAWPPMVYWLSQRRRVITARARTMDTVWTHGQAKQSETFDTVNPATGEVIATFPVHGRAEVDAAVERAREAAAWWSGLGWQERQTRLLAWKSHLIRYVGRLAELIHNETGKPLADAQLEIFLAVVHIDWAARNARGVLGPRRVRSGIPAINLASWVEYAPLGVIGVMGPWNYPVFTPMGSIAYALAAGNAVVFKPSELTPATGGWLVSSFGEVVPEHPVLQLVTGAGGTGEALAGSAVNKIAFTGSAATARRVMAACAENLTPLVAECGGKDAFIVGADADLDAAADACAWGALSNSGQTCIGVERVYVVQDVYHQ